jgi:16S rRNA (cytosine967-C5)-methyltransferase
MKNGGKIVGWDIHPHKIELVNSATQRLGIGNIELSVQDATKKLVSYINMADRVLVDAPCTGLGILRRKPDIKWNRNHEDLDEICKLQKDILNTVCHYVKPGGILTYSTCTLSDKENIDVIKDFIAGNSEFELVDIEDSIPKGLASTSTKNGYIQLFPNKTGTDGFFICKMKRN